MQGVLSSCITSSTSSINDLVENLLSSIKHDLGLFGCITSRESKSTSQKPSLREMIEERAISQSEISQHNTNVMKQPFTQILQTQHTSDHVDDGIKNGENKTSIVDSIQNFTITPQTPRSSFSALNQYPEAKSIATAQTPRGSSTASNVTTEPKSVAWSSRAKHSSLRNQARQDAQIQKARLQQVLMDSRQKREKSVKREFLTTTGSGRFSRSPVLI